MKSKFLLFNVLVLAAALLAACGGGTPAADPFIQTAVAQTVAAKNAEPQLPPTQTAAPLPSEATQTPLQFSPTTTALPVGQATTAAASNGLTSECGKAAFVSETIVDGTIFKPGTQFTKTWEIKNTSSCTWDTNYRVVYWGGDDMLGGAYYYNLTQPVAPGGIIPISIVLTAPTAEGTYVSKWALQTSDQVNFGVGEYSNVPFSVKIVVSANTKQQYGVTNVQYSLTRDPKSGCPANVWYYASASVSTNGPLQFKYYWRQSDGHTVKYSEVIKVSSATVVELPPHGWKFHIADTPGDKWMVLGIAIWDGELSDYVEYPPGVTFTKTCGG